MMEGMTVDRLRYWSAYFRIKEERALKERLADEAAKAADAAVRTPRKRR